MNRFKKYVRNKGIKLEQDYPYLPFELPICFQSIESVIVDAEHATVKEVLSSGIGIIKFNREGELEFDFV